MALIFVQAYVPDEAGMVISPMIPGVRYADGHFSEVCVDLNRSSGVIITRNTNRPDHSLNFTFSFSVTFGFITFKLDLLTLKNDFLPRKSLGANSCTQ